ncbi:hypothetical protein Tco_1104534 [Tanacetum coccineum]
MHTEPTGHANLPSLDAELPLTNSETESNEEVHVINARDQDEGQAGPNPDEEFTTTAYPNVQENLKLPTEDQVILEGHASSTGTLSSLQNLDKDLSFTDQFFMEKPHEEESGKTNAETEVQSIVAVPIHSKTLPRFPNRPLLERLDKQGTQLYNLENLNIPHKVSQAVDEIVTDAVDWPMQAPLRAHFRDLPIVDMKEILQQQMFEDNSYQAHEIHNDLYEALQKSLELDYSNQRLADQEEARKKKRKKRAAPRTPSGSPLSPPPPLPPPSGAFGTPGISGTLGSSQLPPPPPPPSTGASGSAQFELTGFTTAQELSPTDSLMQDDSIPDEQVHLSDDEDSRNDHLPKADSRQDWWKPLHEEERPATPEPAWTIPSFNVSDIENNWASTLVSTYETLAENSLLAKTGDMKTFLKGTVDK